MGRTVAITSLTKLRGRVSYSLERSRRGRIRAWLALLSSPTPQSQNTDGCNFPSDDPDRDRFTGRNEKAVVGGKLPGCPGIRITERPLC
jgi:hypothetical protein